MSEHQSKKRKIESSDQSAPATACAGEHDASRKDASAVVEKEAEALDSEASGRESNCAICFESENLLDNHSCTTCKARAWCICDVCNEALLSRICPFCKTDYKEMVLKEVPGLPLCSVRNPGIDPEDKMLLMIKIKSLGDSLIPAGNTLVWYPLTNNDNDTENLDVKGRALFALPRGFDLPKENERNGGSVVTEAITGTGSAETRTTIAGSEEHRDGQKEDVAMISVDMLKSELFVSSDEGYQFHFKNSTWSMLEAAVEDEQPEGQDGGEAGRRNGAIEFMPTAAAAAAVLRKAISSSGSKIFLPLEPQFWVDMDKDLRDNIVVHAKK